MAFNHAMEPNHGGDDHAMEPNHGWEGRLIESNQLEEGELFANTQSIERFQSAANLSLPPYSHSASSHHPESEASHLESRVVFSVPNNGALSPQDPSSKTNPDGSRSWDLDVPIKKGRRPARATRSRSGIPTDTIGRPSQSIALLTATASTAYQDRTPVFSLPPALAKSPNELYYLGLILTGNLITNPGTANNPGVVVLREVLANLDRGPEARKESMEILIPYLESHSNDSSVLNDFMNAHMPAAVATFLPPKSLKSCSDFGFNNAGPTLMTSDPQLSNYRNHGSENMNSNPVHYTSHHAPPDQHTGKFIGFEQRTVSHPQPHGMGTDTRQRHSQSLQSRKSFSEYRDFDESISRNSHLEQLTGLTKCPETFSSQLLPEEQHQGNPSRPDYRSPYSPPEPKPSQYKLSANSSQRHPSRDSNSSSHSVRQAWDSNYSPEATTAPTADDLDIFVNTLRKWARKHKNATFRKLGSMKIVRPIEYAKRPKVWDVSLDHKREIKDCNIGCLIFMVGVELSGENQCTRCFEGKGRLDKCIAPPHELSKLGFRCANCRMDQGRCKYKTDNDDRDDDEGGDDKEGED